MHIHTTVQQCRVVSQGHCTVSYYVCKYCTNLHTLHIAFNSKCNVNTSDKDHGKDIAVCVWREVCFQWFLFWSVISAFRQRPYHVESTGSRPITEVKQRRARLVLGWVTAWEPRVLLALLFCSRFLISLGSFLHYFIHAAHIFEGPSQASKSLKQITYLFLLTITQRTSDPS